MLHEVLEAAGPLQAELQTHNEMQIKKNVKSSKIKRNCHFIQSGETLGFEICFVSVCPVSKNDNSFNHTANRYRLWHAVGFGTDMDNAQQVFISSVGALAERAGRYLRRESCLTLSRR